MGKPTKCDCVHINDEDNPLARNGWYLYILLCQQQTWYVGISRHLDIRLRKHFRGEGAKWTKRFPPVALHRIIGVTDTKYKEMRTMEDMFTLGLMQKKGLHNVRGGTFVKSGQWTDREVKGLQTLIGDLGKLKRFR